MYSAESEQKAQEILQEIQNFGASVFFEKPLTASDTSGSGRVVIPKAVAEQYFPRLDLPSGMPVRAVDTRGHEYTFKFRFWVNNQSRMYLLEGAGELHRQFAMNVGDVMVFAQKPDKTLVVAGRPATKNDVIRKPPVKRSNQQQDTKSKQPKDVRARGARGATDARKKSKTGSIEIEPPIDGVFRAVPHTASSTQRSDVAAGKNNRWIVTLNLAGELYQAHFDSHDDALEAYNAAVGALPGKDPDPTPVITAMPDDAAAAGFAVPKQEAAPATAFQTDVSNMMDTGL